MTRKLYSVVVLLLLLNIEKALIMHTFLVICEIYHLY